MLGSSRYTHLRKSIFSNATIEVMLDRDNATDNIPAGKGVREGETISPTFFALALEDIFKKLSWGTKGIYIDSKHLTDDIVFVSRNVAKT